MLSKLQMMIQIVIQKIGLLTAMILIKNRISILPQFKENNQEIEILKKNIKMILVFGQIKLQLECQLLKVKVNSVTSINGLL
jgi:hypothetical protein